MSILRRRALIAEGGMPYWDTITEDWDYIIDQTGKYENPIIVNKKNLYGDKLSSIASIRDLSKLVVGYYDETSAKLIWEPLDNSSKTIVKHPTSAYPINIKVSDYIIDLGMEGGDGGGTVIASGTPEKIAQSENSYTGQWLKKYLYGTPYQ